MRKIMSEIAKYEDMVKALSTDHNSIEWTSYVSRGEIRCASSVRIGDTPEQLINIGFANKVVYDKAHFLSHQNSKTQLRHGHGGTIADMLSLPQTIKNPVAIITDKTRNNSNGVDYQPLLFLCIDKDEKGEPMYYISAVQPKDVYDGVFEQYQAMRVITCYQINKTDFDGKLATALHNYDNPQNKKSYCGKEHVAICFDAERYNAINQQNVVRRAARHQSFACNIGEFYVPKYADIDGYLQTVSNSAMRAATIEARRFVDSRYINHENTRFTPLIDAKEKLESRNVTLEEALLARQIIGKVCNMIDNRILRQQVKEKGDILFARAYIRIMNREYRYSLISEAINMLAHSEHMANGDKEKLDEQINDMVNCFAVSTNGNPGIKFEKSFAANRDVVRAVRISNEFATQMRHDLGRFVEVELAKQNHLQQAGLHQSIEFGNNSDVERER